VLLQKPKGASLTQQPNGSYFCAPTQLQEQNSRQNSQTYSISYYKPAESSVCSQTLFFYLCFNTISCRASVWPWGCSIYILQIEVNLRPTVSRPALLGVRHASGTRDQFFFLLEIFFRQLRVCYFVVPTLTRGRVCNLLFLLVLANAVQLGSVSRGSQDHILLSRFLRLPQPGGPGTRIYIPQE
jgi:hypothetical protein